MSRQLYLDSLARALAEARAGSADALNRLFQDTRGYLMSIVARKEQEVRRFRLDPEDLVQDTLLKASCSIGSFRGETPQELLGWLGATCRHVITDTVRRAMSQMRFPAREVQDNGVGTGPDLLEELPAAATTPEDLLARHEELATLLQAVAQLPALLREVVWLRFVEDLSHAEIGRYLGRSENAVPKLCRRALVLLHRL